MVVGSAIYKGFQRFTLFSTYFSSGCVYLLTVCLLNIQTINIQAQVINSMEWNYILTCDMILSIIECLCQPPEAATGGVL